MKTVIKKRNKNPGKKKQITNPTKPINIFTFECAIIFLNSLVRNSVLYAKEAMYNKSEKEMRQLKKIEEDHTRNILDLKIGISYLYMEVMSWKLISENWTLPSLPHTALALVIFTLPFKKIL